MGHAGGRFWQCRCDCGTIMPIASYNLRSGGSQGCRKCRCGGHNRTHGAPGTRLHSIWAKMLDRCRNQNCKEFKHYGARGIAVCTEWQAFEPFRDWAVANGYEPHLTIERRDNADGYHPGNCTWATMKTQCRNRRSNRFVPFNGRQVTLAEASEATGIRIGTLWRRLNLGWPPEKALSTPVAKASFR